MISLFFYSLEFWLWSIAHRSSSHLISTQIEPLEKQITKMAVLNSNPEVLLRKRKNADRKRIEKQDAARVLQEKTRKKVGPPKDKFVRAETLALRNALATIEKKRVENILKHQNKKGISSQKELKAKLLFVIRITPQNKLTRIPEKALDVLKVMRLEQPDTGVFIKLSPAIETALKVVAPYIVVGQPSLASVRHLFFKRAEIPSTDPELPYTKLDNNDEVEKKFGDDLGFICIEDLIREIVSLGDNFKEVTRWVAPFKLKAPAQGWTAVDKINRLRYEEENKKVVTLAGHAKVEEIDIDKFLEEQT